MEEIDMCFVLRSETGRYEENGNVFWKKNGVEHREDGPAIEWAYGSKQWWKDGIQHRLDGPAVEWADGTKEWYVKGKRHRLDGPAIEWPDGDKEWWVNGESINVIEIFGYEPALPLTAEEQTLLILSA